VYSLQTDNKMYRRSMAGSAELERIFTSTPNYIDSSSARSGLSLSSSRIYVLNTLATESSIWSMDSAAVEGESGPAQVEVAAQLPFRAVGLHVDPAGMLYTFPSAEGTAELGVLWRWDPTAQQGTEIALSTPIPIHPRASPSDLMPGLRVQMFADEPPWIGAVVQVETDPGTPLQLPTVAERVFKVHAETGEVRIVGSKQVTWP
jgi:hypothetical protein